MHKRRTNNAEQGKNNAGTGNPEVGIVSLKLE